MTTRYLGGIVPPILTPLTESGDIDVPSLEHLTDRLVQAGCHGVFALGSTGEIAYLSTKQRKLVLETVVHVVAGRVPVLAGAIDLTLARVREQLRLIENSGVAAVVVTAPFYARNDKEEVETHFRDIAATTDLDVWAYDIPVRVGTKLDPDTLLRLAEDQVIVGLKDSSADDVSFRRLLLRNQKLGFPLRMMTGHEILVDGMFLLGAHGAVPGLANVDPEGYLRLWHAARNQDWVAAKHEQNRLAELFEIVFSGQDFSPDASGVGAFKAALYYLGEISSPLMTSPTKALPDRVIAQINNIVDRNLTVHKNVSS